MNSKVEADWKATPKRERRKLSRRMSGFLTRAAQRAGVTPSMASKVWLGQASSRKVEAAITEELAVIGQGQSVSP